MSDSPKGVRDPDVAEGAAPRVRRLNSLQGKVGALFDISKPRGTDLLDRVEELLRREYGVKDVLRARKRTFTKRAPEELLIDLAKRADFVVLAVADCGSCDTCLECESRHDGASGLRTCGLSTCMDEALFLESKGVPTAVVATTDYERAAEVHEVRLGVPRYPMVTVRRSIQRLPRAQVWKLADEAMETIVSRLIEVDEVSEAAHGVPTNGSGDEQ